MLDDCLSTNPYFRDYDSKEEEKESYEYHNNLENDIYSQFSEYYQAKYDKNMEEDLLMMYYLNYDLLYDKIIDSLDTDKEYEYFWYSIDREKTYFNSKLNGDDNKVVINVLGYTNPHEIVFDDNYDASELGYDEEVVEQFVIDENTRYLDLSQGRSK